MGRRYSSIFIYDIYILLIGVLSVCTLMDSTADLKSHSCATVTKRVRRDDLQQQNDHHLLYWTSNDIFLTSAYFSGTEILQFDQLINYGKTFTVEFWMKPEGGQNRSVALVQAIDMCANSTRGYSIGLKELDSGKDARVYFTLKGARTISSTTLSAHINYRAGIWTHVAVTYNGETMSLYLDHALVAAGREQTGVANPTDIKGCQILRLGGDPSSSANFRGELDEFRIWGVANSHKTIIEYLYKTVSITQKNLELYESFDKNIQITDPIYTSITGIYPRLIGSTVPQRLDAINLRVPHCGLTICDNPDIIRSYSTNQNLLRPKILRYRIVNVANDDGTNPTLDRKVLKKQHDLLSNAFSKYNITWEFNEITVKNSTLRQAIIVHNCNNLLKSVLCHSNKCNHTEQSTTAKFSTVKCEKMKNYNMNFWSIEDYKRGLGLDNKKYLNIYFVQFSDPKVRGISTFPWDRIVYGMEGGLLIKTPEYIYPDDPFRLGPFNNHVNTLIHELGHVLGLYHVHQGVEDRTCTDRCYESHASLELGDLCADTQPTPRNEKCKDPPTFSDSCGERLFTNTPYNNYMSYSKASCANQFTPQQTARMHCYTDLIYSVWKKDEQPPSAVPLKPQILLADARGIKLGWYPPIGKGADYIRKRCHRCKLPIRALQQYAIKASSSSPQRNDGYWKAKNIIGPPDAPICERHLTATWTANDHQCTDCFIEVEFEEAVIPVAVKIWVGFKAETFIADLILYNVDGTMLKIGGGPAQCDVVFTKRVQSNKLTKKLKIYVSSNMVSLDAVQLISTDNHPSCDQCLPIQYIITRLPRFDEKLHRISTTPTYVDKKADIKSIYSYEVTSIIGGIKSPPSPILTYSPKIGFCGDGILSPSNGEECDDGNVYDDDGCSIQCRKEDVFKCNGEPSLCYRYLNDGVCEDFEKSSSIGDCGYQAPVGFEDQWAVSVIGYPEGTNPSCPAESVIPGPPPSDLKCHQRYLPDVLYNQKYVWWPCKENFNVNHWLIVSFSKPVVASSISIYLASDGINDYNIKQMSLVLQLIDIQGNKHPLGSSKISCSRNPVVIPILHDMTKPFFKTNQLQISFSSDSVAIAAVSLRSSTILDPVEASLCNSHELYNRHTHRCYSYKCEKPSCSTLIIDNATVNCNGIMDGDECLVVCDTGFRPLSTYMTTCVLGTWNNVTPCRPVDCGVAPKVKNAFAKCQDGTTFGKTCTLNCHGSAVMHGGDDKITCLSDGLWSTVNIYCTYQCPYPKTIKHSVLIDKHCKRHGKYADKSLRVGSTCRYKCLDGYQPRRLSYTMPTGELLTSICDHDGKWQTDSLCIPSLCPELGIVENHVYNCSRDNRYGSECTLECFYPGSDKIVYNVRCGANGKWTDVFKLCKYKGTCQSNLANGDIILDNCQQISPGSHCRPSCKNKKHNILFEGKPKSHSVSMRSYCLPSLEWFPSLDKFSCVPRCDFLTTGDGICDCMNNSPQCGYDKGDCCRSTNRNLDELFSKCLCIDPAQVGNSTSNTDVDNGSASILLDGTDSMDDEDGDSLIDVPTIVEPIKLYGRD